MLYTQHNSALLLATFLSTLTTPAFLVTAYVINSNSLTPSDASEQSQQSPLATKVIFQSPSVENIFKDFIVASKPLNMRKYSNRPKTKKTKKDSRIYYIPIPPLPYRFLPGIGYDYQPMKIKPLLVESEPVSSSMPKENINYSGYKTPYPYKQYQQHLQNSYYQAMPIRGYPVPVSAPYLPQPITTTTTEIPVSRPPMAESKVFHVDRNDYYFNGRPFRLQVAHAGPKYNLTPQNLKSSFYFNKNIIY